MQSDLNRKVVLVTGATSGIGRATAVRFAEAGARVAAVGRNQSALEETIHSISEAGGEGLPVEAELANEQAPAQIVSEALNRWDDLTCWLTPLGTSVPEPLKIPA
jgi:NADP-dependent 3-hydroxy acid dehydrogenase YdfG